MRDVILMRPKAVSGPPALDASSEQQRGWDVAPQMSRASPIVVFQALVEVEMSPTPPITSARRRSVDSSANDAGDGVTLNVVEARGAQRNGAIWILAVSLTLAIVALGAFWLIQAPRMQAVTHPSGRDLNTQDVRKLYPQSAEPPAASTTKNAAGGV